MRAKIGMAALAFCAIVFWGCPAPVTDNPPVMPTPKPVTTPSPLGVVLFSGVAQFGGSVTAKVKLAMFRTQGGVSPVQYTDSGSAIDLGTVPNVDSPTFVFTVNFANLGFTLVTNTSLEFDMWEDADNDGIYDIGEAPMLHAIGNTGDPLFGAGNNAELVFAIPSGQTTGQWYTGFGSSTFLNGATTTGLKLKL